MHSVNSRVLSGRSSSNHSSSLLSSRPPFRARKQVRSALEKGVIQAKLSIGAPSDSLEREADQVADRVMGMPQGQMIQPACRECEEETLQNKPCDQQILRQPLEEEEEMMQPKLADGNLQRQTDEEEEEAQTKAKKGGPQPVRSEIANIIHSRRGQGVVMPAQTRRFFEPRFGRSFQHVRIHNEAIDHHLAESLGARAFTLGRNIFFGPGEYSDVTFCGQKLLAHELTHVVQQTDGKTAGRVQRDLAVTPPSESAEPRTLSADEYSEALEYNRRRFEDPFTIKVIRDVAGISPYPAVIDRDFVNAVLRWQAWHNHNQDGKAGPRTTRTMVRELRAEGMTRLANQLRQDNYVRVHTVNGPTFTACTRPDNVGFRWDVGFTTSLRNGFIVQRIDNIWNETPPPGRPAIRQTPRYWEAWRVDGAGRVRPNLGAINDMWTRITRPGSRGNWRMTGTLYTVLRLPAAAGFVGGGVPDAGILQSTVTRPSGLGLPEGYLPIDRDEQSRTIGGTWNCTNAVAARNFHRRR